MSGHSHAKTVARTKNAEDAKKSKAFSKVAQLISVAAKQGPDPESNSKLRMAIEQAKSVNMPKDTIERAIKKGSGELAGENLEEATFEALGPGGIGIIIETITDNKNRVLQEIKHILNQNNGKIAGEGSVKWMFERKGILTTTLSETDNTKRESFELKAIEAGAEDMRWIDKNTLEVYTKADEVDKVKNAMENSKFKIDSAELGWVPKEEIQMDKEKLEKLFNQLDDNDSVQSVYSNASFKESEI